jgi:Fe-S cluster biogenesis protein NfuA
MFIQTEATPNPATLKFVPGRAVMGTLPPADFPNAESASVSPLASALFDIENVAGVFLGSDFISITKSEGEWQHLKPALLAAIMDHFVAGRPVMQEGASSEAAASSAEQDPTVHAIIDLIDTRIRPAVAQDGGDIVFHDFQDGIVSLQMRGACAGCPSSTATLKQGIENLLKHYIPEVQEVRAVI